MPGNERYSLVSVAIIEKNKLIFPSHMRARTNLFNLSFFPSTIRLWNELPLGELDLNFIAQAMPTKQINYFT